MCIFECAAVKSDCPMHENYEIFKDLIQTVDLLYQSGDIKKKKKTSSENDQLTGHFQSFFSFLFFVPPTLNLTKIPVNRLIKKFWP